VTFYRQPSVFLNGYLRIMGHSGEHSMILDVDMEGNTWRKTDRPSGLQHSMHQGQSHLCVCTIAGSNYSKLSIWSIMKGQVLHFFIMKGQVLSLCLYILMTLLFYL
jgi:hypothetical protein